MTALQKGQSEKKRYIQPISPAEKVFFGGVIESFPAKPDEEDLES